MMNGMTSDRRRAPTSEHDAVLRLTSAVARRSLPHRLRVRFDQHVATHHSLVPLRARSAVRRRLRRRPVLPYLETHVTDHCNLACAGCDHYSPLSSPSFASPRAFGRDLERLVELFDEVKTIRLLGGEPLLHPEVLAFARCAREAFPFAYVELLTNGVLVDKMPESFWRELGDLQIAVGVSAYPIAKDYAKIREIVARRGIPIHVRRRERFCRIPVREAGDRDPDVAFHGCRRWMSCPMLRDGRLYPCPRIPYARLLEGQFGAHLPVTADDFVDLHEVPDGYAVTDFLERAVPWCRHCDPGAMQPFSWSPSRFEREEWGLVPATP